MQYLTGYWYADTGTNGSKIMLSYSGSLDYDVCPHFLRAKQNFGVKWRHNSRAGHPLFGKKSSGAAAYCYSNKKVAPLPLLACKTTAAAATLKK